MTIDWSKAPEGATHWDPGLNCRIAGWMRFDADTWYWWPAKDAYSCPKKWHASLNQHMIRSHDFIPRPYPWNGEGLPPVGASVEVRYAIEDHKPDWPWHKGECVLVGVSPEGDEFCVVRVGEVIACFSGRRTHIRPVRTPEQIAAEDRDNFAAQVAKDLGVAPHNAALIQGRKLYDLGYRKQVAP